MTQKNIKSVKITVSENDCVYKPGRMIVFNPNEHRYHLLSLKTVLTALEKLYPAKLDFHKTGPSHQFFDEFVAMWTQMDC